MQNLNTPLPKQSRARRWPQVLAATVLLGGLMTALAGCNDNPPDATPVVITPTTHTNTTTTVPVPVPVQGAPGAAGAPGAPGAAGAPGAPGAPAAPAAPAAGGTTGQ